MTIEKAERERFERLLPGYVCDRLDAYEREWLEQFVAAHPEMAAQVDIERELRNVLRAELPEAPADQGLVPFMARIHADGGAPPANSLHRFKESFRASLALPTMKLAWTGLASVVVVQAGIIALLFGVRGGGGLPIGESGLAQWRSTDAPAIKAEGPVLQLTFKPTATEAEIRLLLVKLGGTIVAGPGQLGHYIVRLADGQTEAVAQQLRGHEILVAIEVLPDIPKED